MGVAGPDSDLSASAPAADKARTSSTARLMPTPPTRLGLRPSPPSPQGGGEALADLLVVEGGARPDIHMLAVDEPLPMAGHLAMQSMPAIYGLIRQHRTTLVFVNTRMQAEAVFQALWDLNDDGLADRAASRLARRRAAPPGRGGDGRGQAQGGGVHLDARPRRRLGRRRSRRQRRRAEGGLAHHAAHRPLEPPHGRAVEGVPRAGEPLRDPRMPRRARRRARGGAGHAGCPPRGARRALPAHPRHGLRRAVRRGRALRGGELGGALHLDVARGFRRRVSPSSRPAATRCAPTSASPRSGKVPTGSGGCATAGRAAIPAQRRHHHRGDDDQGPARARGAGKARHGPCRAAGACSARSRSISPRP